MSEIREAVVATTATLLELSAGLDPVAVRYNEVRAALIALGGWRTASAVWVFLGQRLDPAPRAQHTLNSVRTDLEAWAAGETVHSDGTGTGALFTHQPDVAWPMVLVGTVADATTMGGDSCKG